MPENVFELAKRRGILSKKQGRNTPKRIIERRRERERKVEGER